MKIYRVRAEVGVFQAASPNDETIWRTGTLSFDCSPKASHWQSLDVFIGNPRRKRGNFFGMCPGTFLMDSLASDRLLELFEMSGELLPVNLEGETLFALNVIDCVNALSESDTTWVYGRTTGARIRIEKYVFIRSRLTETPLFKIPETCRGEILTAEGLKDPEDEFKFNVESSGLQGLIFEEVWAE